MQKARRKIIEKAGILTFHFAHNCGAVLQAYALYRTVSEYMPCEIINYQPEYHASWGDYRYKYEYPPTRIKRIWRVNKNKLRAIISTVYNLPGILSDTDYNRDRKRTKVFERFLYKNIHCSKLCRTAQDVQKISGKYGVIFSGSDQVWNPKIVDRESDNVYFLPFGKNIKKCSYAASAGGSWDESDLLHMTEMLSSFDGISCREPDLKEALENKGLSCRLDIDPAFLLKNEDYYSLEKKVKTSGKYVFVYAFQITEELIVTMKALKRRFKCEFISYPLGGQVSQRVGFRVREINPLGPGEFLYLMHYAEYVVTSTFHGVVFATIYKKQFICLPPVHGKNRIDYLLKHLGLEQRFYSESEKIPFTVDYSVFEEVINRDRHSARGYIHEMCKKRESKRNLS